MTCKYNNKICYRLHTALPWASTGIFKRRAKSFGKFLGFQGAKNPKSNKNYPKNILQRIKNQKTSKISSFDTQGVPKFPPADGQRPHNIQVQKIGHWYNLI